MVRGRCNDPLAALRDGRAQGLIDRYADIDR